MAAFRTAICCSTRPRPSQSFRSLLLCISQKYFHNFIACINREKYCPKMYIATDNFDSVRDFSSIHPNQAKATVNITYLNRDGQQETVKASVGENLLDIAIDNDLDIDGFGACEGTLACSTCHLIFDRKDFDLLPSATDEELDMLDLAHGLKETSRLGCQVCVSKDMDGMQIRVPEGVNDVRDV